MKKLILIILSLLIMIINKFKTIFVDFCIFNKKNIDKFSELFYNILNT